jgi:hypothetical protein
MIKWIEQNSKKYKWLYEETLTIPGHGRNANQNHTEIPTHLNQNGYHQEHKPQMLVRMCVRVWWGAGRVRGTHLHCCWEVNSATTVEISMKFPQKN